MATLDSGNPLTASGPESAAVVQGTGDFSRVNNLTAIVAPTATDDVSKKYSKGSLWYDNVKERFYICKDNTVGAAVWRRVRRGHLGYIVGNWYAGEMSGNPVASAQAMGAGNRIYFHPLYIPELITISELAYATANTIAGNTQLALYRANGTNNRPGTRLGVTASNSNAVAATGYSVPLVDGNLVLEPGWYWGGSACDAASTFVSINNTQNEAMSASMGSATLANAVKALGVVIGVDVAATFNTDPKTTFAADLSATAWVDHTAGRLAKVFFKVAAIP